MTAVMATCTNGHANAPDARFCVVCGLVIAAPAQGPAQEPPGPPGSGTGFAPGFSTPVPHHKQRKGWVIPSVIVGILAAATIIVLATGVLSGSKTTTVNITMTIYGIDGCSIGLGYIDVPGSVVVLTADDELVGTTTLSEYGTESYAGCEFDAAIPNVTTQASLYSLAIGSRGEISSSNSELKGNSWLFQATLGD